MKQLCFLHVFIVILSSGLFGQEQENVDLKYISPAPGSKYIMPLNNIALRHGDPFLESSLKNDLIKVSTTRGTNYKGQIVLSDDDRTVLFLPDEPYLPGDEIIVTLQEGLKTKTGLAIKPVSFRFYITEKIIPVDEKFIREVIMEEGISLIKPANKFVLNRSKKKENNLPEGFAPNDVLVDNNPPEGYYFYTPYDDWNWYDSTTPFLTITDKYGTPVYYRGLLNPGFDFKIQPGGYPSFYSFQPFWKHQVLDSCFNIIGTYQMGNGYTYTDFHDFVLTEDGHAFVMTFDPQLVDMSQIVPGGNPEAIVSGFVLQEQDPSGNVIFQWRSWDHFEITETGPEVDLTDESIDPVHGNTIEVESDTSFLISSRNMHEITKIHRNTGEIIWRLGGSQNQFDLIGDTIWFSRQHDSRRNSNGYITAYDNGTKRPDPKFSSAVEYAINTEDSTATLVNRYRRDPDYLGITMGNAFWSPENTVVVGWGSTIPGITEFDSAGNVLYELFFEGKSYRAFRFPWETNYFLIDKDSVTIDNAGVGVPAVDSLFITNPLEDTLILTSYYTMSPFFSVQDSFPVIIPPEEIKMIVVEFTGDSVGVFRDVLTFNSDINSDTLVQRIARQSKLTANVKFGQSIPDHQLFNVSIYPNSVGEYLIIKNNEVRQELYMTLVNMQGQKVNEISLKKGITELKTENLDPGLYFVKILSSDGRLNTYKVIKQ